MTVNARWRLFGRVLAGAAVVAVLVSVHILGYCEDSYLDASSCFLDISYCLVRTNIG